MNNKKGISLIILVITIIIMIIIASSIMVNLVNTNIINQAEEVVQDINLKNMQHIANMAYANIYLDNLSDGIRRELTAEEIRLYMIKDGIDEEKLANYDIVVENGNVIVSVIKENEN